MSAFDPVTALRAFGLVLLCACGGGHPAAPPAPRVTPPVPAASATPEITAGAGPGSPASPVVDPLSEDAAAQELAAADFSKLLQVAKLSPKTHKGLLKGSLWKTVGECPSVALQEVKPAPGLLVSEPGIKVRENVQEKLKAAGALARQRGMAIEVVGGQKTVKQAVSAWNSAVINAALRLIKAAPPAAQKEKSFAVQACAAVDEEDDPKGWDSSVCESGVLGGWSVQAQLVTTTASGTKGQVLVKSGPDGDRFVRDTFETTYWDKAKGKSFRTLTEIMSAGCFVRLCSSASQFTTTPSQDSTWRCRAGTESWEPSNRPIPAWQ